MSARTIFFVSVVGMAAAACGGETAGSNSSSSQPTSPPGSSGSDGSPTGTPPGGGATTQAPPASEACSDGPIYGPGTNFPFQKEPTPNLAQCVLHCGEPKHGRAHAFAWTQASLPSGSCSTESEACQLAVEETCVCPAGKESAGPYSVFECRCGDGQWHCSIASKGASVCACLDE